MLERPAIAKYILLTAFVLVFGFFGYDKFENPLLWVGFLPRWMDGLLGLDKNAWIKIIGGFEILLAAWLLIPMRRVRQIAVLLIIGHLIAVLTQVGWNDIGVRDVGLLLASVALLMLL